MRWSWSSTTDLPLHLGNDPDARLSGVLGSGHRYDYGSYCRTAGCGETAITRGYLEDLKARYDRLWETYTDSPILRMSNEDLNYRDDRTARERVLWRIKNALAGNPDGEPPGFESDREVQTSLFAGSQE